MPLSVTPLSATDRPEALRPHLATGLPLRGEVDSTQHRSTPCRNSRTPALRNRETHTPLRKIDRCDRCWLVQWMKARRGVRALPPSAIGGRRGADFKVLDRGHIRRPRYAIRRLPCLVFTGVKLEDPWGRHFLRVCPSLCRSPICYAGAFAANDAM